MAQPRSLMPSLFADNEAQAKNNCKDNTLDDLLPIEIWMMVIGYLTPQEIMSFTLCCWESYQQFANNKRIWRDQLKTHFPHAYHELVTIKPLDDEYKQAFNANYEDDYRYLSPEKKHYFSLIKSSDLNSIMASNIMLDDLAENDANQTSLLTWMINKNNQSVLDYFYSLAKLYYRGSNKTLLHWAVILNQPNETITTLLDAKFDINATDQMGWTALHYCAQYGRNEILSCLLTYNAKVDVEKFSAMSTPLHLLVEQGNHDAAKLLLDHGALINAANEIGWTALHIAIDRDDIAMVKLLLTPHYGANLQTIDFYGWTALHLAVKTHNIEIIKHLLAAGANPSHTDHQKRNTLHIAAEHGNDIALILLIETHSQLVNSKDNAQTTPLHLAAAHGHVNVAATLITHGANINQSNRERMTALHIAARNGRTNMVELLIKHDANFYAVDWENRLAFHAATLFHHTETAKMLAATYVNDFEQSVHLNPSNYNYQNPPKLFGKLLIFPLIENRIIVCDSNTIHSQYSSPAFTATNAFSIKAERALVDYFKNYLRR